MMDIYTVVVTQTDFDSVETIPWVISFPDLNSAKLHVLEEAALHLLDKVGPPSHAGWEDWDDYSTYTQSYGPSFKDVWLVTKTQLADSQDYLERNALASYSPPLREQDGEF